MPSATDDVTGPSGVLSAGSVGAITRLSAVESVRARITLALELGLLELGERLPDPQAIADALDVSTATVRRALRSLSEEGFLERRRGRAGGTFVARVGTSTAAADVMREDAAEIHRLIDLRALAEQALAAAAAWRATPADLAELDASVAAAAAAGDWTSYHAADRRFHLALGAAGHEDWAHATFTSVLHDLYRYFVPYPIEYLRGVNEEHRRIVAALREGDAEAAARLARDHVLTLHGSMFVGLDRARRADRAPSEPT